VLVALVVAAQEIEVAVHQMVETELQEKEIKAVMESLLTRLRSMTKYQVAAVVVAAQLEQTEH